MILNRQNFRLGKKYDIQIPEIEEQVFNSYIENKPRIRYFSEINQGHTSYGASMRTLAKQIYFSANFSARHSQKEKKLATAEIDHKISTIC